MAAPMDNTKLSKADRKRLKKQNRSQRILGNRDGIEVSETPTKILCVCNVGLDNGVSREEVVQLFKKHGCLEDIIMMPRKPYAFVCYCDKDEAQIACTASNGTDVLVGENNERSVKLHIFYVSKAPTGLSPSSQLPPGLIVLEDFIDKEYEDRLIQSVLWEDSSETAQQKTLKHRRVKHYGYEFKYSINNVDPDDPLPQGIPDVCKELLEKALETSHVKHYPDQLTVNQYQSGQGIPPHVDTPSAFEDGLMSLSLGSQALIEFYHPDGRHLSVLLPPRSLLIMTGESRYVWSHGITPRKSDIVSTPDGGLTLIRRGTRTSFTFRKITGIKYQAPMGNIGNNKLPATNSDAADLERTHVHEVYERIANHFSGTRHTPWPRIASFLRDQAFGSLLLDIGCGNGKYFGLNRGLYEIGSDRSCNLAQICCDRGFQVFTGDVLAIPLRSGVCDVCLCIAVIHHLSTQARREKAIEEILRVLQPGGKAIIYVWAFEQELHKIKSKYLKESKFDGNSDDITPTVDIDLPSSGSRNDKYGCTECTQEEPSPLLQRNVEALSIESKITSQPKECYLSENQEEKEGNETALSSEDGNERLGIHVNRTKFKQQDMLVPWQLKNGKEKTEAQTEDKTTCYRYYHMFRQGDLEKLCKSFPYCKIIDNYYDQGNWAVILEKT